MHPIAQIVDPLPPVKIRLTDKAITALDGNRPGFKKAFEGTAQRDGEFWVISMELLDGLKRKFPITRGWGDTVAKIAEPIAKALDHTIGTKIEGCGGCAKRRAMLNRAGEAIGEFLAGGEKKT